MSNGLLDRTADDVILDWEQRCLSEIALISGEYDWATDKRASVRHSASGTAFILPRLGASVHCTLVDRSDGGARLKVLSVLGIPDEFILNIGYENLRARIAWRSPNEIGVSFLQD